MYETIISFLNNHEYPLQTLFVLAVCGLTLGALFDRIRLPHISGQLLAGILLGPAVLKILNADALYHVELLSEIVLGMMAFTVGTHLNHYLLHNAWMRIFKLALGESLAAFAAVWLTLSFIPMEPGIKPLLAAIAMATAPGTVIGLIQAKKARGVMIKTLLAIVALNNVLAIVFFEFFKVEILHTVIEGQTSSTLLQVGLQASLPVLGSMFTGLLTGQLFVLVTKRLHTSGHLFVAGSLLILLNLSLAHVIPGYSGMLINLAAGMLVGNRCFHTRRLLTTFENVNGLMYPVFFTLAGTHLNLSHIKVAGFIAVLFSISRAAGKISAVKLVSTLSKYPKKIGNYLGMGLIPQAGLAIGLVISMGAMPAFQGTELLTTVTTIVLAAVAIDELIGPFTTAWAFDLAEETGQANPRLIDFLHEEFILMPLKATDKWNAIRQLCDFMVKSHQYKLLPADQLYDLAVTREKEMTTGLGKRIAIPHVRLPYKDKDLLGVIGILDKPLDFESLDDNPVRIVILLMTPKGLENKHIKVFSSIGKIFSDDPMFQERLIKANTPAEVYDLLQSKEVREINYFMDNMP